MSIDSKKSYETLKNNGVEERINTLMTQIEGEYKFKGNTLEKLFSFKLNIDKKETIESSNDFKNALIAEIEKNAQSGDIVSNNEDEQLSQAKYEALANKIIEINKLSKEIQAGIQDLRAEILNDSFKELTLTSNSLITKGLYGKDILARIDNPKNLGDQLLGLGVAGIETGAVIGKFTYDLGKDIILSPYHLVQMIRGKAKYDGIEI